MERPKIEEFFPEGTTLTEAMNEYKKSPPLFNYIQALDGYADYLENEGIKQKIATNLQQFNLKFFQPEIFEDCIECGKKRPKGVICNYDICPIRFGREKTDDNQNQ